MNVSDEDQVASRGDNELNSEDDFMSNEETREQGIQDRLIAQVQENKTSILLVTSMLGNQGVKIDKIHDTLIGNGGRDSVYARLVMTERNHEEAMKERVIMGLRLDRLTENVALLEQQGREAYITTNGLKEGQKKLSKDLEENTQTIQSWRNKAIGIGLGVGVGTSIILFLLQQLISQAATIP
jgi:hypothetical protein